jgi:hypothetical protein
MYLANDSVTPLAAVWNCNIKPTENPISINPKATTATNTYI